MERVIREPTEGAVRSYMKKIVIIGANEFQNRLILKAKDMGYETHVFAWKEGAVGEQTADYFYPISITEKERILGEARKIKPEAVVSIASDLATITVNYIARELNLICNSDRCIQISTNKYDMRKAFLAAGVETPEFYEIGPEMALDKIRNMKFPVIVKPTDRSGSRGITKIENIEDLEAAVISSIEYSFEKKAIVEEYIEGNEYSCECISYRGKHYFLTVTQKFTTGAPNFIETGHLEPGGLNDEMIKHVKKQVFKALDSLEIKYGATHSEFKIDHDGNVRMIEIGARMGGDCIGSDLVQISTGYDFLKMTIQTAAGQEPDLLQISEPRAAAIKFIFSEEDIVNLSQVQEEYPEKVYFVSSINIDSRQRIVDSASRYGFYILSCDSREEAMRLANL